MLPDLFKYSADDPQEYKKRIVLDSSKSKLTLSEIYEKQYLDEKQKASKIQVDEKESEEHTAIKKDMDDLFRKLDALSNFHFVAPPPEPQVYIHQVEFSLDCATHFFAAVLHFALTCFGMSQCRWRTPAY